MPQAVRVFPVFARRTAIAVLACVAVTAYADDADSNAAEEPEIRALLVTGGCCHDYDEQTQILKDGLAERLSISVEVVRGDDARETELEIYREADWAAQYDIVIHNECYGGVTDEAFVKGIVKAHLDGTPAVFIHCAMHSYRDSPAADQWRNLIGLTSRRHESKHAVSVVSVAETHPIMQGFPDVWTTKQGELYVVEDIWPGCEVLATAYGTDTGREHPVIWTNTRGLTRVFGTTLGHYSETMREDLFLDTLARGIEWTLASDEAAD